MDRSINSGGRAADAVGALLAKVARNSGHAPLLTFYGADGEYTELSYATFDNWASKTANLLVEELEVERGTRVVLRAPDRWTTAAVVAGAWKVGAQVVAEGEPADVDVAVVGEADAAAAGSPAGRLLVMGDGFGGRVSTDTPGLPFGDEVLAFGDDYADPQVDVSDVAVVDAGGAATHDDLLSQAAPLLPTGARVLSFASLRSATGLVEVLVAPLVAGGSVVWCPGGDWSADDDRVSRERVTHIFGNGEARPV